MRSETALMRALNSLWDSDGIEWSPFYLTGALIVKKGVSTVVEDGRYDVSILFGHFTEDERTGVEKQLNRAFQDARFRSLNIDFQNRGLG